MPKMVPISFEQHGKKCLLQLYSYSFTAEQNLAVLVATEFAAAAHSFPIVFVKPEDKYLPMALLGLKPDSNLLVDNKGKWQADYIPAAFRRYPFNFIRTGKDDAVSYVLGIDEESGFLTEGKGEPLFTAEGKPGRLLEQALQFASEYQKQVPLTSKLCEMLEQHALLSPLRLTLQEKEKKINIEGLLVVDEKKLNALSDESFLALRSAGLISLIYLHLFSIKKIPVLTSRLKKINGSSHENPKVLPKSFKF